MQDGKCTMTAFTKFCAFSTKLSTVLVVGDDMSAVEVEDGVDDNSGSDAVCAVTDAGDGSSFILFFQNFTVVRGTLIVFTSVSHAKSLNATACLVHPNADN